MQMLCNSKIFNDSILFQGACDFFRYYRSLHEANCSCFQPQTNYFIRNLIAIVGTDFNIEIIHLINNKLFKLESYASWIGACSGRLSFNLKIVISHMIGNIRPEVLPIGLPFSYKLCEFSIFPIIIDREYLF